MHSYKYRIFGKKSVERATHDAVAKTFEPRSNIKRIYLHEWLVLFCGDEVNGMKLNDNVSASLIKKLKTLFNETRAEATEQR